MRLIEVLLIVAVMFSMGPDVAAVSLESLKREGPTLTPEQLEVMGHLERLKGIRDEVLEGPSEPDYFKNYRDQHPLDGLNVQLREDGQQKFVGALLWDFVDLITFGAFEKKKQPKPPKNETSTQSPNDQQANATNQQNNKSSDSSVSISRADYDTLVNEVQAMKKESQDYDAKKKKDVKAKSDDKQDQEKEDQAKVEKKESERRQKEDTDKQEKQEWDEQQKKIKEEDEKLKEEKRKKLEQDKAEQDEQKKKEDEERKKNEEEAKKKAEEAAKEDPRKGLLKGAADAVNNVKDKVIEQVQPAAQQAKAAADDAKQKVDPQVKNPAAAGPPDPEDDYNTFAVGGGTISSHGQIKHMKKGAPVGAQKDAKGGLNATAKANNTAKIKSQAHVNASTNTTSNVTANKTSNQTQEQKVNSTNYHPYIKARMHQTHVKLPKKGKASKPKPAHHQGVASYSQASSVKDDADDQEEAASNDQSEASDEKETQTKTEKKSESKSASEGKEESAEKETAEKPEPKKSKGKAEKSTKEKGKEKEKEAEKEESEEEGESKSSEKAAKKTSKNTDQSKKNGGEAVQDESDETSSEEKEEAKPQKPIKKNKKVKQKEASGKDGSSKESAEEQSEAPESKKVKTVLKKETQKKKLKILNAKREEKEEQSEPAAKPRRDPTNIGAARERARRITKKDQVHTTTDKVGAYDSRSAEKSDEEEEEEETKSNKTGTADTDRGEVADGPFKRITNPMRTGIRRFEPHRLGFSDLDVSDVEEIGRQQARQALLERQIRREDDDFSGGELLQLQKKVGSALSEHSKSDDDIEIDSVFHSYSHYVPQTGHDYVQEDEAADQQIRTINQDNAYQASQEVMRQWFVDLDNNEEQALYKKYFLPAWRRHENSGVININDSVDFMRDYLGSVTGGA